MKTYYDILEIDKEADGRQVKSAYFKLVRKYPPERFPEEFKQLRAAYEALSDEKTRRAYDRMGALPYEAAFLYAQVVKARYEHRLKDTIEILKMILKMFPTLQSMKVELARTYEHMDMTGNAIKVWEELCEMSPGNSMYSYELALSYRYRGWRKKAIKRFEQTIAIAPDNPAVWASLIDCHDEADERDHVKRLTFQALQSVKSESTGIVSLHTYAFTHFCEVGDKEAAEGCLLTILDILKNNDPYPDDEECESAIHDMFDALIPSDCEELLPYLLQIAELAPDLSDELKEFLELARMEARLDALIGEGYPEVFPALLSKLASACDCQDCINDIMAMEANIFIDLQGHRPYIIRLKEEHADLYATHSAFFSEALTTRNPEKPLYHRLKKLSRQGLTPNFTGTNDKSDDEPDEGLDEEAASQSGTYRREGPKIGRNDPCPCGSGKKYKKCCAV